MRFIIILLLIPVNIQAVVFTPQEWTEFYLRDCAGLRENQACRQKLEVSLGKMVAYSDFIFSEIEKQNLPKWLAIIPIIESDYNHKSESTAGAIGLWQLMPFNIEYYKTHNSVFLGRKIEITPTSKKIRKIGFNPVLNTKIALAHFKTLFEKYKDDEKLIICAYNAGDSRVEQVIAGKSNLPDETKNYYNKFIAVKHIIKNMEELNIKPVKTRKFFFHHKIGAWF